MKILALFLALSFPLDPALWQLDPQQPDAGTPFMKHSALAFNFPTVDTGVYTGNLYLPWTGELAGTLTATVQVLTFPAGDKPVRFIPAPGACVSPPRVYLYFQTGPLYDSAEGTRWWTALDSWPLADTGGATVQLSASLDDPARWFSVYGHPATSFPAEFANAKAHPTIVGLTFGGNCTNGHGVATGKGTAQFRLSSFSLQ